MNPILEVNVTEAAVERIRRQDQDEVLGLADEVQQGFVELSRAQLVHVQEDIEVTELEPQVHLKEKQTNKRTGKTNDLHVVWQLATRPGELSGLINDRDNDITFAVCKIHTAVKAQEKAVSFSHDTQLK